MGVSGAGLSGAVIGVDGCRAGWVAVTLNTDGGWSCALHPSLVALWSAAEGVGRIWLDMPIGLTDGLPTDNGQRGVESACRAVLGIRRNSVFNVPVRSAAYAPDYLAAKVANRVATGKGLSVQSWHITAKIREADGLLRFDPSIRSVVVESHPEVVFWALNGGAPMQHNKKTAAGRAERMAVLTRHYPKAGEVLAYAETDILRRQAALDDVVDALCLAVGARFPVFATFPAEPKRDSFDLPMQVVYPVV